MRSLLFREKYLLFGLVCAAWAMMFAAGFVFSEDPVYSYDSARSHNSTIKLLNALSDSVPSFLNTLRSSFSSSYNDSADLLPAMMQLVSGSTSRQHFIMSLALFYLAPLCLLLPRFGWKLFGGVKSGEPPLFLSLGLMLWAFLYAAFWPSLLGGFTDLASLIPFLIALGLAYDTDITLSYERRRMILIGLCLYIAFMFRRWYIFAVGSFYLTYLFISLAGLDKKEMRAKAKTAIKNLFTAGLTNLILMAIIQFPVLRGMVLTKYSYKYAAYDTPMSQSLMLVYNHAGGAALIVAAVAAATALIKRKHLRAYLFCLLCPVIFFLSFSTIQGMGPHHTLLCSFFIWLLAASGLIRFYLWLPNEVIKKTLVVVITIFMIAGFRGAFTSEPAVGVYAALFPQVRIAPARHPNFAGLSSLISDLEELTEDSAARVYVAAGSGIINDSLLRSISPHLSSKVVNTKGIDKRDGIIVFQLVNARYAVVTEPIQLGGIPSETTTLGVPAQKILKGEGLGRAYERLDKAYDLGAGVTAYIFEKKRGFTGAEVEDYLAGFPADYTDWPNQVSEDDRLLMKIEKVGGSEGHRLLFDRESKRGDYVLMSGLNPPASVVLNLEDLSRIKFSLSVASWAKVCGGQARVSVGSPDAPADVTLLKAGDSKIYDLNLSDSKRLAISSEGAGGTSCNRVYLKILEKE